MALNSRIVEIADIDEILEFEAQVIAAKIPDESERIFAQWNSRARREAMEHYFSLGWSFLTRDPSKESKWSKEGRLEGYFLGQALLFFEGQTQSLWIENITTLKREATNELCELAYKLSREKHLQRVYLPETEDTKEAVHFFKPKEWKTGILMLETTKVNS